MRIWSGMLYSILVAKQTELSWIKWRSVVRAQFHWNPMTTKGCFHSTDNCRYCCGFQSDCVNISGVVIHYQKVLLLFKVKQVRTNYTIRNFRRRCWFEFTTLFVWVHGTFWTVPDLLFDAYMAVFMAGQYILLCVCTWLLCDSCISFSIWLRRLGGITILIPL